MSDQEQDTKRVTLPDIVDSSSSSNKSPRSSRSSRVNKLYRAPPTPTHDKLLEREKSFVIDSVAVSSIQNDFFSTNPKLGAAILPYNSQNDRHCRTYFYAPTVPKLLKRTGQDNGGHAISGVAPERFHKEGYLYRYFSARNKNGIGHSFENIAGHHSFMMSPAPIVGYNGQFGFRRNTPELRHTPSPFGISSRGLSLY